MGHGVYVDRHVYKYVHIARSYLSWRSFFFALCSPDVVTVDWLIIYTANNQYNNNYNYNNNNNNTMKQTGAGWL